MDNSLHYKGGFTELDAWKEARIFKQGIIKITKQFPAEEKYSLTDQIKRSSRSVTANIAEGYGRFNYQETTQFIRQARGSLTETYDHLFTAFDEGYINEELFKKFEEQYKKVLKLINGYISFLQKSKTGK
jgi:four helix bundle protein